MFFSKKKPKPITEEDIVNFYIENPSNAISITDLYFHSMEYSNYCDSIGDIPITVISNEEKKNPISRRGSTSLEDDDASTCISFIPKQNMVIGFSKDRMMISSVLYYDMREVITFEENDFIAQYNLSANKFEESVARENISQKILDAYRRNIKYKSQFTNDGSIYIEFGVSRKNEYLIRLARTASPNMCLCIKDRKNMYSAEGADYEVFRKSFAYGNIPDGLYLCQREEINDIYVLDKVDNMDTYYALLNY